MLTSVLFCLQVLVTAAFESREYSGKYPAIRVRLSQLPRSGTSGASNPSNFVAEPANAVLYTHQGFKVSLFAEGLSKPRWLQNTPEGFILVTETRDNRIKIIDWTDEGVKSVEMFADSENGLYIPFGMEFIPINSTHSYFFVGNTNAVTRFEYEIGSKRISGRGEKIYDLPGGGYNQHWTRNIQAHPDNEHIYVSVGSRSNVGVEPSPRASIIKMRINGSEANIFGSGLRNPVGMDVHPVSGDLYTTVNERDWLGDDLVPDYFTKVEEGQFFGWPYTFLSRDNIDPRVPANPELANQTVTPDVLFQAHSAALGLKFYDKTLFPASYRNGSFVAFRGSWNRRQGTGYKIVFVPFHPTNHTAFPYYEDFVTGFLLDPNGPTVWGRPVGLLVLKDGSLLFTDEPGGKIYRVKYVMQLENEPL